VLLFTLRCSFRNTYNALMCLPLCQGNEIQSHSRNESFGFDLDRLGEGLDGAERGGVLIGDSGAGSGGGVNSSNKSVGAFDKAFSK
jgi:hypothetical protein